MKDLYKIISEVFDAEETNFSDEYGPDDIEKWDSINQLNLVISIEEHYNIKFEDEEIFEILTIGDIKTILSRKKIK